MSDTGSGGAGGPAGEVGSMAEEATKLLGAVADWARDHGTDLGASVAAMADLAGATAHDVSAHIATDDPECRYCPVCRSLHAVRTANPEVRAQLSAAASSLLQAAAGMLAAGSGGSGGGRPVERIDLDDDEGLS